MRAKSSYNYGMAQEAVIPDRNKSIRRILLIVLALNWAVALAKILYGLFSRCASITADGFHSLSDGASNIIGLIGIAVAAQPTDKDHPYGHKKYETFFSLAIAGLLFIICYELLENSIRRLHNTTAPMVDIRSFVVMVATLCVNLFVVSYEYKRGKQLQSDILISDSLHTKADILISLSVIAALIVIKLGYPIFDPIVTMVIALFIAYTAFDIARTSSRVLCDQAVIINDKMISDIVLNVAGVKNCHKIRTRGRADDIYIDLHVQVKPHMHVDEAHKVSYSIEDALKKGIPGVSDVVVHIEPRET